MPRTITTTQTTFTRPGTVTYDLYRPPRSSSSLSSSSPLLPRNPLHATTITLPPHSPWTSGLHWHETHTEYLQVIQGAVRVTLNGETAVHRATGDGKGGVDVVVVPRGWRHEWRRADVKGKEEEVVIVREWTDPVDGEKEVFFRNLNGVILDAATAGGGWPVFESLTAWVPLPLPLSSAVKEFWLTWQLFVIFAGLDNYPVVYSGPCGGGGGRGQWSVRVLTESVEWMVTHVLLLLATWVGGVLGLRAVYEEYTPRDLWVEYGVRRGLGGGKERVD